MAAEHRDIVLDAAALADPRHREAVLRAADLPTGLGDMDTSLYLLFREIRRHSTVALSGESADELFGGYAWFHQRESVYGGTFPGSPPPRCSGSAGPAPPRATACSIRI